MARQSESKTTLLAQDQALDAYLDALLQVSTEQVPQEAEMAAPEVIAPSRALALVPVPKPESKPEPEDGVPEWAREKFQCLLFHVGPLKLAVPLAKLTRIQPWGEHITATPGRPDWFLGLLARDGGKTGVIDTARLVFPRDRRSQAAKSEPESGPGHILLVEGGRWGLTCDSLGDVIELQPEAVRWRTQRTARRWLAGTVLDQMCALLDVEVLARMVAEDESVLA
ncbi:MAG: chemotaxis protein CheW [Acidihalobacter sp.]|jgi:purine-binding chemotaxis protein CheW|uniref:chemotaxis protein CheW n=1 Tax=Acidihalobacter sp. TaxID=1872108 RepID=UPI00307E940F